MDPMVGQVPADLGRTLQTYTWGEGSDVAVLEAGLGFSGRYWGAVARALAQKGIRAVAYDRAGFGGSTPDPRARTLDRLAVDLARVVAAQRARRLVLVGHSWGGPVVRVGAPMVGTSLRAVVLVDPSDEHVDNYPSPAARLGDAVQAVALPALARAGVLRWLFTLAAARAMDPADRRPTVAASSTTSAARATVAENRHLPAGLRRLLAHAPELSTPLVVISGAKGPTRPPRNGRAAASSPRPGPRTWCRSQYPGSSPTRSPARWRDGPRIFSNTSPVACSPQTVKPRRG